MSVVELAPIVKSIEVRRSAADCFRIYVHEASRWWPLDSHALSPSNGSKAIAHVVEPRVGGRVYEVAEDGREFDWGEVLAYEPGRRFAMTWQLGRPRLEAGEVEVVFEPTGDESCRLTLTHSGWERLTEQAGETREGYNKGWAVVFEQTFKRYAEQG